MKNCIFYRCPAGNCALRFTVGKKYAGPPGPSVADPGWRLTSCSICGHLFVRDESGHARNLNREEKDRLAVSPKKEYIKATRAKATAFMWG